MLDQLIGKKIIYPLMALILTIKIFVAEYFYLISQLTERYTFLTYLSRQFPIFLIYKIAIMLIIVSWGYFLNEKKGVIYIAIVNLFNSVIILAMAMYISAFHRLPSFSALYTISNLGKLSSSIIFMIEPRYIFLFIDCVIMFMVAIKIQKRKVNVLRKRVGLGYLIIGSLIIFMIPYRLESYAKEMGDSAYHFYHSDSLMAIENHSYLTYNVLEIVNGLSSADYIELTANQNDQIDGWFRKRNKLIDGKKDEYFGVAEGKNIILIQVESLENQLVDRKVGEKEITPFLNSIKDESLYFPNIYEQVGEGNSSDSEFMLNTSLYPINHGVTFYQFAERVYKDALPNLLKMKGYYNIVVHGDRKTFWNRNNVYPGMGYDEFLGIEDYIKDDLQKNASVIGLGLSDRSFFRQSVGKIEKLRQPYMALLITLTTHTPFKLQKSEKNEIFPEVEDGPVRDYLETFSYMDKALEEFFVALERKGLLKDTIIVIFGDHEGINKYYRPEAEWVNGMKLPLIIYGTEIIPETKNTIGGQIDIMPTILDLVGIDPQEYRLMGKSLLRTEGGCAIMQKGIIKDEVDEELIEIEQNAYAISNLILKSQEKINP